MARTSLCAYLPLAGKVGMPSANSGHATPQWVYDLGVSLVTEVDNSVLPQYWNPLFLQSYNDFIQAFASHYDGNPHVSAIEMGIGVGGETRPDLEDWRCVAG